MKPVIIISTYPTKKSISKIANDLVKNKTVACVNISKISSIYSWKGKVENTSEFLAIFKTITKNKAIANPVLSQLLENLISQLSILERLFSINI